MKSFRLDARNTFQDNIGRLIAACARILSNNPELSRTELFLAENQITADYAPSIVEAIQGKAIASLSLRNNPLNDDGVEKLSEGFKTMKVQSLEMANTGISDHGLTCLTSSLPTGLQRLKVDRNSITMNGLRHLVDVLPSTSIEEVNFE